MKTNLDNREGFWHNAHNPLLPTPIANDKAWVGRKTFLERLIIVEGAAKVSYYRGHSVCRLCSKPNGSGEFLINGWRWPDGLAHYIEAHNVRPSLAFQEFILGKNL